MCDSSTIFESLVPKLYQTDAIRRAILENSEFYPLVTKAIKKNRDWSSLDKDTQDEIFDAISERYCEAAKEILRIGYDGNAPGMSGIICLYECGGVYSVDIDGDSLGYYSSMEEVVADEMLKCVASPDVVSDYFSHDELVALTKGEIVPMDEDGFEVLINNRLYVVDHGELREEPEESRC